ncbi:hypothetical protein ACQP2F_31130 [Actinoplanes sp. CA-030573]|uniref:hypothetical protein n=1 Tax=Actinoplanes sp. CA-030573 TaxID=3239898 RepID=UPI003D8B68FB
MTQTLGMTAGQPPRPVAFVHSAEMVALGRINAAPRTITHGADRRRREHLELPYA